MACGLLTQVALTAVLLGTPGLKVDHRKDSKQKFCTSAIASNANATVTLRDAKGKSVFEQKIRINDLKYYDNEEQRGGYPAKDIAIVYSYPRDKQTAKATSLELKLDDRSFAHTVNLPETK